MKISKHRFLTGWHGFGFLLIHSSRGWLLMIELGKIKYDIHF